MPLMGVMAPLLSQKASMLKSSRVVRNYGNSRKNNPLIVQPGYYESVLAVVINALRSRTRLRLIKQLCWALVCSPKFVLSIVVVVKINVRNILSSVLRLVRYNEFSLRHVISTLALFGLFARIVRCRLILKILGNFKLNVS